MRSRFAKVQCAGARTLFLAALALVPALAVTRALVAADLEVAQAGGLLAAFEAAAEALAVGANGALFFALLLFRGPLGALEGQADLALFAVDAQDLDLDLLPDLHRVL